MDYNLLDAPWIPVLHNDGEFRHVGILEALAQAHQIREIAASNPMDRIALPRFLLAVLYWCKGNPPETCGDPAAPFPVDWFAKLDAHRDCFNLLGDGKRFYQDPEAKRKQPTTQLIQEVPSGNNFCHFGHSSDRIDGLCLPCCARGLLRLPLFSTSGLSGPGEPNMMAGINGAPPIYMVPSQSSLLTTLLASWVPHANLGLPSWMESSPRDPASTIPLLVGLTLPSRRVWLHEPVKTQAACVACGARFVPLVLTCEFQTAGKQETDQWVDPHVLYLPTKPRKTARAADLTTAKFKMDRPWPDLLARTLATGRAGALLAVGFATNKAKNVDVWERRVTMPLAGPTPQAAVTRWSEATGKQLETRIAKLLRPERPSKALAPVAMAAIRPGVEAKVSAGLAKLLLGDERAWQEAADEYRPMLKVVAGALSPGFTTAALARRREIAALVPEMAPHKKTTSGSRKKGGDK
jgi:hypothetical protein